MSTEQNVSQHSRFLHAMNSILKINASSTTLKSDKSEFIRYLITSQRELCSIKILFYSRFISPPIPLIQLDPMRVLRRFPANAYAMQTTFRLLMSLHQSAVECQSSLSCQFAAAAASVIKWCPEIFFAPPPVPTTSTIRFHSLTLQRWNTNFLDHYHYLGANVLMHACTIVRQQHHGSSLCQKRQVKCSSRKFLILMKAHLNSPARSYPSSDHGGFGQFNAKKAFNANLSPVPWKLLARKPFAMQRSCDFWSAHACWAALASRRRWLGATGCDGRSRLPGGGGDRRTCCLLPVARVLAVQEGAAATAPEIRRDPWRCCRNTRGEACVRSIKYITRQEKRT